MKQKIEEDELRNAIRKKIREEKPDISEAELKRLVDEGVDRAIDKHGDIR